MVQNLAGVSLGATKTSVSVWQFALLLIAWVTLMITIQLFMMSRSSKVRTMPATGDYQRLGFVGGHGLRFVGGVSASSTDSRKRCTYPFGEMLVDDQRIVLRVVKGFAQNRIDLLLEKSDVVRVTRGRKLWVPTIRFETVADNSGKIQYFGNGHVFAQLAEFGWPTADGAPDHKQSH